MVQQSSGGATIQNRSVIFWQQKDFQQASGVGHCVPVQDWLSKCPSSSLIKGYCIYIHSYIYNYSIYICSSHPLHFGSKGSKILYSPTKSSSFAQSWQPPRQGSGACSSQKKVSIRISATSTTYYCEGFKVRGFGFWDVIEFDV